jgi:hypothetical protein
VKQSYRIGLQAEQSEQTPDPIVSPRCLPARALHGGRFNFFRDFGGEAVSPIIGDRPVDDRSAVDTFPRIEDQEKVRESFQHHQSFALRAIHNYFLPRYVNELARGNSKLRSSTTASQYQ